MTSDTDHNIDAAEVARFAAQAQMWWDTRGKYKALHQINPVRTAYVQLRAGLAGRAVADVGCGGGLLSESMAMAGARVTGIDMAEPSLAVARDHARQNGLSIDYRCSTAEQWAGQHPGGFDVVTCMELVEHVPDPGSLIRACAALARPGGHIVLATVNRTGLSGDELPALERAVQDAGDLGVQVGEEVVQAHAASTRARLPSDLA